MNIRGAHGFTLIEILMVVSALAIIAGMTIVAINPAKQLADARNGQRRADVGIIWGALHQYALDHHGVFPASIPSGTFSDCTTQVLSDTFTICKASGCGVDLLELWNTATYLTQIPVDPTSSSDTLSGYNVLKDTDHANRVTVCAPGAEQGEAIYLPL